MLSSIIDAFKVPELRKKILFTLAILALYRFGAYVPVPGIPFHEFATAFQDAGVAMTMLDLFTGGALSNFSVFSLGIMPYITASIIIQLLTIAIPALERLARDGGEAGKKKIASITRYATVAIALLQGFGYYMICKNYNILEQQGIWPALVIIVSFVAGSSFVMWLGEQVNEFGVGNGISIILFAGILSRVPNMITMAGSYIRGKGSIGYLWIALLLIGMLAMVVLIVHVNEAERRIPVQYAKRQVGRKMYGGQASTLPMKVNMSGVLPIIFAQSIASLPATIWAFVGTPEEGTVGRSIYNAIDTKSVLYLILYFLMIIGFSYFYATIQFNPVEISNNLKRNGGFIPGFRPGKPTSDFIAKVLNKVTLFGAIYLGIVAICPLIAGKLLGNPSLAIGGTSVIIVVGVALETVRALESQMMMRQYKGFLE